MNSSHFYFQDTQNYQFRYYVRDESTGDIKSQEETKQGGTVNGHYSVGEPTGDLRVVTYTADEGGFRADVKVKIKSQKTYYKIYIRAFH